MQHRYIKNLRVRSGRLLRHCTTTWKVAGLIPDTVNSASNTNEYQEYLPRRGKIAGV